ncbi:MAG: NACHT domain-containing protein, partial [Coleofasciculus sp. Co-bin14]|nr:NACHT domain-containing protein [Coleofasciculus sp. Co-bin14]
EWLQQQVESYQGDPSHLTKLSNEFGNRPSVLVVDQFEEAFTLCRDDSVRQAFIDNLISLIQSPGVRHTVILTMRTDFESQVARVPVFKDLFEQAQVRVTALDASELREAIEKPAELVGLKFEEGLVEALLQDVLGEPAALPLLQFTLLKLWDNRERNRVTWETYKRLGGGRQALARSADEFYEQLIPEEQVTVKRLLLRMVRPTEGLEVTSNRIQRKTLYQAGEARDRVDRVLDKLIQSRLVRLTEGDTPDDAQVEVAHEALVRNWPRLVNWLEDERVNLRRRWRLAAAVEDWQARGRDKSVLLRGSLLAEAQRYKDLNALEVEFIQCSVEEEQKVLKNQTLSEILKRVEAKTHTNEDLKLLEQLLSEGNPQAFSQLEKQKLGVQQELINTRLEVIEELLKVTQFSEKQHQELNSVKESFRRLEEELIETEKITNKLVRETVDLLESKPEKLSSTAKASLEFEKILAGINLEAIDIVKEILIDENSQSQRREFRSRQALLKQVKNEVDSRLAWSLHSAVLINLGKEKQPQQVERPWVVEVNVSNQPSEPLPPEERIIDFFDREAIAGKFLILGAPGAGKTTTLLELAEELVSRAEDNAKQPMPVLFNLSTWQDDRQSIAQWLVAELKDKYGVRKAISENWLKNKEFLPLLDGLDELASERQEKCVQAINQFLASEERSLHLVVCSRSEEYGNYETRLQLNGAIYLQPLSNLQIRDYLADIAFPELMQTISRDPTLLELIRTPLLLSVTTLAYLEISLKEWQRLNTSEERLRYLLDTYIRRMLARPINSKAYSMQNLPTRKQVQYWLVWLARQLQRESQTEFLIERMQPRWLTNFFTQQIYALGVGLVFGSVGGLLVSLIVGLNCSRFFGAYLGLIIGVIIGLFFSFFFGILAWLVFGKSKEIKPVETLNWSWLNIGKSLIVCTIIGFITSVITKLIFPLIGWHPPELVLLLIIGLPVVSAFEMNSPEAQRKTVPNQGILQSRNNAIRLALLGAAWMGVSAFWTREKIFATITSLILKSSAQSPALILSATDTVNIVLSGMLAGLFFGLTQAGIACIQHFTLRFVLYCKGYIPWNYARFLNYATERMLLQRVGGRYRFIHRLLQEHFAQMELNQE